MLMVDGESYEFKPAEFCVRYVFSGCQLLLHD